MARHLDGERPPLALVAPSCRQGARARARAMASRRGQRLHPGIDAQQRVNPPPRSRPKCRAREVGPLRALLGPPLHPAGAGIQRRTRRQRAGPWRGSSSRRCRMASAWPMRSTPAPSDARLTGHAQHQLAGFLRGRRHHAGAQHRRVAADEIASRKAQIAHGPHRIAERHPHGLLRPSRRRIEALEIGRRGQHVGALHRCSRMYQRSKC